MADNRDWLGATTPSDLNVAANWLGAALPIDGDFVRFLKKDTGQLGPTLNVTALTLVRPALIYVGEGYTQNIGGSGAGEIEMGAAKFWYRGTSGKYWFKDGTDALATAWMIVDSTSSSPYTHDCVSIDGATVTLLDVLRGMATAVSGATITDFYVGSRNENAVESQLVLNVGVTLSTSGEVRSGLVTCNVACPTIRVNGGTWDQKTAVAGSTGIFVNGGRLNLHVGGTYAKIVARGGVVDGTQDGGVKVVTDLYVHPSAKIIGWNEGGGGMIEATNTHWLN